MDLFHHVSWYYSSDYEKQNDFFEKLKKGINKFPFKTPYEIAKVNCIGPGRKYPIVSILVLRGSLEDDSIDTVNKLTQWFDYCGCPSYEDEESNRAVVRTIQEYFISAYGDYEIIDIIKSSGVKMGIFGPSNIEELKANKNVKGLIEALKDKDWNVRNYAEEALVKIGEPAVEPLTKALKDEDWEVREQAARAFGKIGDVRAVESLIEVLGDEDHHVRLDAADALGEIGEPAIEPLIEALKDKDESVRSGAAYALGKIKDKRTLEPLTKALKDKDWHVRNNAVWALGKIGDKRAVEPLIKTLGDKSIQVSVVEVLVNIDNVDAVRHLVEALKDKDWNIRVSVADALEKIAWKPKDIVEKVYYLIAKKQWQELVKLGESAVEPLIEVLKDKDWEIRRYAADALGNIRDKRAVEPLIEALKDEGRYIRINAAYALGKIGDERALEPLTKALKDEDKDVRRGAIWALKKIDAEKS